MNKISVMFNQFISYRAYTLIKDVLSTFYILFLKQMRWYIIYIGR